MALGHSTAGKASRMPGEERRKPPRRAGSMDGAAAGLETDEEFERALGSYELAAVADELRRFLAHELQTT